MKTNNLIESWKSANMNEIIGNSSISKEMMAEVQGGGSGYVKTLSGECNSSGKSCFKSLRKLADAFIDLLD